MNEVASWRRITLFFANDILDCVVEAFGKFADPLTLFHKIAKRAVEPLAIFMARYRVRGPQPRCSRFQGHVVRPYGKDRNPHGQNSSPGDLLRPCSLNADAVLAEYNRWTASD
jgi:hypothetical protein